MTNEEDKQMELKTVVDTKDRLLIVSCFGDFKVTVKETGEEVKWRTRKARELFAYFIHLQGVPVERKNIILQLWPNLCPNNVVSLLHNMIYSIRKEFSSLGVRNLLQYQNGRYYLQMDYICFDLPEMLLLGQAIENKNEKVIQKYKSLLKVYPGIYFDNIESEWSSNRRDYFEMIYIKGCKQIAEKYIREEAYETAIDYLLQALKVDPFAESIAAMLIRCYRLNGDLKSMKRQYEKFMKVLKRELNLEVSEIVETAFHDSLYRSNKMAELHME